MNQLGLPIALNVQMSIPNFVANEQLKSQIESLFNNEKAAEIYVHGGSGSGKTHLLQAVVFSAMEKNHTAVFIDGEKEIPDYLLEVIPELNYLSIDNIHAVENTQQHMLFDIYNQAKQAGVKIIVSGLLQPYKLPLMKDIKTRLNLATVFQLELLDDKQTKAVLNQQMGERNMSVDEKVFAFLFKHYSRDIKELLKAIDRLDEASLQTKQGISIPLVKKILGL